MPGLAVETVAVGILPDHYANGSFMAVDDGGEVESDCIGWLSSHVKNSGSS
jgi:hypothetical protein